MRRKRLYSAIRGKELASGQLAITGANVVIAAEGFALQGSLFSVAVVFGYSVMQPRRLGIFFVYVTIIKYKTVRDRSIFLVLYGIALAYSKGELMGAYLRANFQAGKERKQQTAGCTSFRRLRKTRRLWRVSSNPLRNIYNSETKIAGGYRVRQSRQITWAFRRTSGESKLRPLLHFSSLRRVQ